MTLGVSRPMVLGAASGWEPCRCMSSHRPSAHLSPGFFMCSMGGLAETDHVSHLMSPSTPTLSRSSAPPTLSDGGREGLGHDRPHGNQLPQSGQVLWAPPFLGAALRAPAPSLGPHVCPGHCQLPASLQAGRDGATWSLQSGRGGPGGLSFSHMGGFLSKSTLASRSRVGTVPDRKSVV